MSLMAVILTTALFAQGEWEPEEGDFTRPRTLLTPSELTSTRERLQTPLFQELYQQVWSHAKNQVGNDNTSSNGRRARARLAKNIGFVLFIDREILSNEIHQINSTDRIELEEKLLKILNEINPDAGSALNYTDWQWRSKELIDYLSAYDLALGAGIPNDSLATATEQLQAFTGNLYREATFSLAGLSFFSTIKNNHALMTAAALGMGAIVLNDLGSDNPNRQPTNWMKTALWNIDNLLWRDQTRRLSEPGVIAGYAEGPHYLRYAALNLLPLFRSLGNILPDTKLDVTFNNVSRTIDNPFYDPNYDLLWEWIARMRTPDGLMPPIEDTFVNEGFPELGLTGKQKFLWPITSSRATLSGELNSTVDMRANFIAAGITPQEIYRPRYFLAMPEAGNLVYRSFIRPPSQYFYFHMLGEHGTARESGGGHNQADAGSFLLAIGQEIMALDPGYVQYSRRNEVAKATDHNMILVDGEGPLPGAPGAANDADAWISDTFNIEESLSFGSVKTAYRDASITRDVLILNGDITVLADFVTADNQHEYTWQLHGNGLAGGDSATGTFTPNFTEQEAVWQRNGASLTTHAVASDGSQNYRAETGLHEVRYDKTGEHTVMRLRSTGTSREFLSALVPRSITSDIALESTVEDGGTTLISRLPHHTVITAGRDTTIRTVSALATDLSGEVSTDAPLALITVDPFNSNFIFARSFMRNGTLLRYNGREILTSSNRTDLALIQLSDVEAVGYSKDPGTIFIGTDFIPHDVYGEGVRSWQILWSSGRIVIELDKGGYFYMIQGLSAGEGNRIKEAVHITNVRQIGDQLMLDVEGEFGKDMSVKIFDVIGREVLSGTSSATFSTRSLTNGVYVVSLYHDGRLIDSRKHVLMR